MNFKLFFVPLPGGHAQIPFQTMNLVLHSTILAHSICPRGMTLKRTPVKNFVTDSSVKYLFTHNQCAWPPEPHLTKEPNCGTYFSKENRLICICAKHWASVSQLAIDLIECRRRELCILIAGFNHIHSSESWVWQLYQKLEITSNPVKFHLLEEVRNGKHYFVQLWISHLT